MNTYMQHATTAASVSRSERKILTEALALLKRGWVQSEEEPEGPQGPHCAIGAIKRVLEPLIVENPESYPGVVVCSTENESDYHACLNRLCATIYKKPECRSLTLSYGEEDSYDSSEEEYIERNREEIVYTFNDNVNADESERVFTVFEEAIAACTN